MAPGFQLVRAPCTPSHNLVRRFQRRCLVYRPDGMFMANPVAMSLSTRRVVGAVMMPDLHKNLIFARHNNLRMIQPNNLMKAQRKNLADAQRHTLMAGHGSWQRRRRNWPNPLKP